MIACPVCRRTRQIGIRIARGAARWRVLQMIVRHGLGLAGIGVLGGCVLGYVAARALSDVLYHLGPTDPVAWGSAIGVLVAVAAVANVVPARRAARLAPSVALRAE